MRKYFLGAAIAAIAIASVAAAQVDTAWVRRFVTPGFDAGWAMTADPTGNVYVTGRSGTSIDVTTLKYAPDGTLLWSAIYSYGTDDQGYSLAVDSLGFVYVAANVTMPNASTNIVVLKYNPAGESVWTRMYNRAWYDTPRDIEVDQSGRIFIGATCREQFTADSYWHVICYQSNGFIDWTGTYDFSGYGDDLEDLHLDMDGNLLATGVAFSICAVVKYRPSGDTAWTRRVHGGVASARGRSINSDPQRSVVVVGTTSASGRGVDIMTVKFDSSGQVLWTRLLNGPASATDEGYQVCIDVAGSVICAGFLQDVSCYRNVTAKYTAAGDSLWVALSYLGTSGVSPEKPLAVDRMGNVYRTGKYHNGLDWDYFAAKYNSVGVQQWITGYNGPGNSSDDAHGIAVDDLGGVAVAGASMGSGTSYDIATIRYTQGGGVQPTRVWIDPSVLNMTLLRGTVGSDTLSIGNCGQSELVWYLSEVPPVGWLNESRLTGIIQPGESVLVTVFFDARTLTPDSTYTAALRLTSNAANQPVIDIPVSLMVASDSTPRIVLDSAFPLVPGDPLTIRGRLLRFDGQPYIPGPFAFGVDDPAGQQSVALPVDSLGRFSHTTGTPDTASFYAFRFFLSAGGRVIEQTVVVPMILNDPQTDLPIGLTVGIGGQQAVDAKTRLVARLLNSPFIPEYDFLEAGADAVVGVGSAVWAAWDRYSRSNPSLKVAWPVAAGLNSEEIPPWWLRHGTAVVSASVLGLTGMAVAGFANLCDSIVELVNPPNKQMYHDMINSAVPIATGITALQSGGMIPLAGAIARLLPFDGPADIDSAIVHDAIWQGDTLVSFCVSAIGGDSCLFSARLMPRPDSVLVVRSSCPVDLELVDSAGRRVSRFVSEIPGAFYYETDPVGGLREDEIWLRYAPGGAYRVTVTPDSTALPNDSFSLTAAWSGAAGETVLARNVRIRDIPGSPYEFRVSRTPPGPGAWAELGPVPLLPSGRAVKDGGWLAYDAAQGKLFAAKGYKTGDFYSFDPAAGTWTELEPWPTGVEAKPPNKGSAGCSDGTGRLYATKGNNTQGFWRYDAGANTWEQLADVPLGASNKKVKGGTDLVYHDDGESTWVYLLKGYKTEFWRYNTVSGAWYCLTDAPAGALPKWDKGSWLALAEGSIYAHKAKNHELYAYDLASQTWGAALIGMPFLSSQTGKSKKSKDGGAGAVLGNSLYALKGGNTQDFYAMDLGTLAWTEQDTIPAFGSTAKKKRVKAGADLVTDGDLLYALKGNKTLEFWRYVPGTPVATRRTDHVRAEVQGAGSEASGVVLSIQCPSRGSATVRWSGLPAAETRLAVYDASGRCVQSATLAGSGGRVDLRGLAAGVYLARLSGGANLTQKLVIE